MGQFFLGTGQGWCLRPCALGVALPGLESHSWSCALSGPQKTQQAHHESKNVLCLHNALFLKHALILSSLFWPEISS